MPIFSSKKPDIIDKESIRLRYASFEDFQLVEISKDAENLTYEAFIMLKREMKRRNLPCALIDSMEEKRLEAYNNRVSANIQFERDRFENAIWMLAINEKQKGASDESIIDVLILEGLLPEQADYVVDVIPEYAAYAFNSFSRKLNYALLVFFAGLVSLYFVINHYSFMLVYFTVIALFAGGPVAIQSYDGKVKFRAVLEQLKLEGKEPVYERNADDADWADDR